MTYAWVLDESVPNGVKRLLQEQIETAITYLKDEETDRDIAVHEARKCFKRIRAIFRLIRGKINKDTFQDKNTLYRDLGQELAPVRDAYVMVETLKTIHSQLDDSRTKRVATAIRKDLEADYKKTKADFWQNEATVQQVIEALEDELASLDSLSIKHDSFKMFKKGLRKVYKRGYKRMDVAYERIPDAEAFHDWRKRVKYLWYHMTILQPVHPAKIMPLVTQLDELSDLLGLAHDYAVLYETIASHPKTQSGLGRQLLAIIDYKRGELELSAKPFGEAIYSLKSKKFTKQVKKWWKNPKPILA